jgi:hypothetical protein
MERGEKTACGKRNVGVHTTHLASLFTVWFNECVYAFVLGLLAAGLGVHEFV